MKNWLLVAALLFCSASYAEEATVVSIYDGDTFRLESGETVRLKGVDAFEMKQPLGLAGRNFLVGLILNRTVRLENCGQDRYKRTLCDVYLGDLNLQQELVRQGLALDYTTYSKGRFKSDENFAREHQLGYWAFQETPWSFRRKK